MSDQHDSKTDAKIQAWQEVLAEGQKQLPQLESQLHTKRGISAGFKASAEATLSQMRKVQGRIDEGDLDIEVGREIIAELNQLVKALSDNGRNQELDVARLDGEVKNISAQAKATQALINKEKAKSHRQAERGTQLDARSALQDGETPEDTGGDASVAESTSEATVTPISAASKGGKAKPAKKPTKKKAPTRKKS